MGILDHIHHSTSDTPASTQSTHSTYTDGANDPPPAYNNLDGASPSVLFPEKSHQSQQHYQPQQQPSNPVQLTGLNIQFCHQETIHLVMDQAWSLSGGDFTVTLADGTPIVRCEGNSWSMSKRVGTCCYPSHQLQLLAYILSHAFQALARARLFTTQ